MSDAPPSESDMAAPIAESPSQRAPGLPAMRFEDGDVAVQISLDDSETLLLHSKFLAAKVHMFTAGTKPCWNRARTIAHPLTGESLEVFRYAVVPKQGTFMLEQGLEYCDSPRDNKGQLINSVLFVDSGESPLDVDISMYIPDRYCAKVAAHDYKIFLALVYDLPVTIEDVVEDTKIVNEYDGWSVDFVAYRLADVLAIAQYNLVFEEIRLKITKMLLDFPGIWEFVNEEPIIYANLAKLLKCKPIYLDALRNCLARWPDADGLDDIMETSEEEACKAFEKSKAMQQEAETRLREDLQELALADVENKKWFERPVTWRTTFINALSHRTRKSSKRQQRTEFIARAIWGQHLIQHFHRDGTIIVRKKNGREAGQSKPIQVPAFEETIEKILEAPDSADPCAMFGIKVLEGYVAMFGKDTVDIDDLRAKLISIITEAADIVKKWAVGTDNGSDSGKTANCGVIARWKLTWAYIRHDVPWDEAATVETTNSTPTKDDSHSNKPEEANTPSTKPSRRMTAAPKGPKDPPQVSLEPAPAEWLEALGLLGDASEEVKSEEGANETVKNEEEGATGEWASVPSAFEG